MAHVAPVVVFPGLVVGDTFNTFQKKTIGKNQMTIFVLTSNKFEMATIIL